MSRKSAKDNAASNLKGVDLRIKNEETKRNKEKAKVDYRSLSSIKAFMEEIAPNLVVADYFTQDDLEGVISDASRPSHAKLPIVNEDGKEDYIRIYSVLSKKSRHFTIAEKTINKKQEDFEGAIINAQQSSNGTKKRKAVVKTKEEGESGTKASFSGDKKTVKIEYCKSW